MVKVFKNTFAPAVSEDVIDVDMVIAGLRHGTIREASLPKEVHEAVSEELERLERETISPARALILLLGAMGEIRGRTRLQKYAFLVDMGLYSKKTKDYFTMYGWEANKYGAYSSNLEYHVQKAIEGGLVKTFPVYAPDRKDSTGYKLSREGEKRFQDLLGAFSNDIVVIKDLLSKFKNDRTVDPLIAHAYREYPEYANLSTIRDRVKTSSDMYTKRFRSREDIKSSAASISFLEGWEAYRHTPKIPGRSCTYSLETRRMYYGDSLEDRKGLVEVCGDGGTVYIIAPWSNPSKDLDENNAKTICRQIVRMGYVPFIGIWHFRGKRYEEPSFAVDHGISKAEVRAMLEVFGQKAAYLVRYDLAESVSLGRLET